ncbi:MAG: sulfotransferase domain-containing protein [Betaproteobacteria bacterium]
MDRKATCSCGSGKRYEQCHGRVTGPGSVTGSAAEAGAGPDTGGGDRLQLVNFVIAGTQKGGTTALDRYLRHHPDVEMAVKKEVHFFDRDEAFRAEPVDYAAYHANFAAGLPRRLRGESTPIYMYWESAPERMARYNPALKIIILLRNPITRAYSHWNMQRTVKKRETLPFLDALRAEPERIRAAMPQQVRFFSYVDRGFYSRQLRRLWRHFPAEQMLILKSVDLQKATAETLQRIAEFLRLRPFPRFPTNVGTAHYERPMSQEERQYLAAVFADEIRELEGLLGWDCAGWLASP